MLCGWCVPPTNLSHPLEPVHVRLAVPTAARKRGMQRGGRPLDVRENGAGAVVAEGVGVEVAVAAVAALDVHVLRDRLADLDARLAEVARVEEVRDAPDGRRGLHLLLLGPGPRREVVAVGRRVLRDEALLHVVELLADGVLQGEAAVGADLTRGDLDIVFRLTRGEAEDHRSDDVEEAEGDAEDARGEDGAPPFLSDDIDRVSGLPVVSQWLETNKHHAPPEPCERVIVRKDRPASCVPPLNHLPRYRQLRDEEEGGEEEDEEMSHGVEEEEGMVDGREGWHGHAGQHHGSQADQVERPQNIEDDVACAQHLLAVEHFGFVFDWFSVSLRPISRRCLGCVL